MDAEPDVLAIQIESLVVRIRNKRARFQPVADDEASLRALRGKQLRREIRNARRRQYA